MTTARDSCGSEPQKAGSATPHKPARGGPRSSWPTSLGLEWSIEPPGLVAIFRPRPEHRGPPGYLHGGLAATCLDETMASLGFALDGVHTMTATLNIRYRKPVPLDGSPVRIEAWRDHPEARRIQKVHARMLIASGAAAVEATGLFVRLKPSAAASE